VTQQAPLPLLLLPLLLPCQAGQRLQHCCHCCCQQQCQRQRQHLLHLVRC
jgi:hypothetical protein